ncbi:MAG: hypothetical protein JXQ90_16330 [Cyclobacteriaceae bacterium]
MQKRSKLIALFCLLALQVFAQHEWINFDQDYVKLKVAEDGYYRVTRAELEAVGFSSTIPASRLRLFRRGEEVSIQTTTSSDDLTLDYFEFWGEKNDGVSDAELFTDQAQPHQYYNLFTDSATYFLTWGTTNSTRRIGVNPSSDPSGLTKDSYHLAEILKLETSQYSGGYRFGVNSEFQSSFYDFGEGWTGPFYTQNQAVSYDLSLDGLVAGAGDPSIETTLIGGNGRNHVVYIAVSPDATTFVKLDTIRFAAYTHYNYHGSLPLDQIGPEGQLFVRFSVIGEGAEGADRISIASLKVTYGQQPQIVQDSTAIFNLTAKQVDKSYIEISTNNAAAYQILDITNPNNPVRISKQIVTGGLEFVVTGSQQSRKLAAIYQHRSVPDISNYRFNQIDLEGKNYIIISHEQLRVPVDGQDPVEAYAEYRESEAGGKHAVEVADIFDIYDQFNYGDPSPLAIRKLLAAGHGTIKNLFIIGKGRTVDQDFFRRFHHNRDIFDNLEVMIPTFGLPGGDVIYSVGLDALNRYTPTIPVGRLNARLPQEVANYLDKIKDMEALAFDELWRKNIVQLSGGKTQAELNSFSATIDGFKTIAEGDYMGAKVLNRGKETSSVSEFFNIAEQVNNGLALITLFGHSSNTVTDIEIGLATDDEYGYQNENKYPIILVNGCKAGEVFVNNKSFGEDWMTAADRGSLAFLAHADFALSTNLRRFSTLFYQTAFGTEEMIGASLGEILISVYQQYFDRYGNGVVSQNQLYQMIVQGDPAIKVFGPEQPDFEVRESEIYSSAFDARQVLANQDSFKLHLPIRNFGKTTTDSLSLKLIRHLPGGDTISYVYELPSTKYLDTLNLTISNGDFDVAGENRFQITIDYLDSIDESNELNNQVEFQLFISQGSTFHLFPTQGVVTNHDTVDFIWHPINLLAPERTYEWQISTSSTFEVPLESREIQGSKLLTTRMRLPFSDTTTLYWRTRFSEILTSEDSLWSEGYFTYHPNQSNSWGQYDAELISNNRLVGMNADPTGNLSFKTALLPTGIYTMGSEVYNYDELEVIVNGVDLLKTVNLADSVCKGNSINAVVFDGSTANPYRPIQSSQADVFNDLICGRLPQMVYNLDETDVLGTNRRLDQLIAEMDDRDQILLFNIDSVTFSNWDTRLYESLAAIGVDQTDLISLSNGQPLIIFGEKGSAAGNATIVKDDNTILDPRSKVLTLDVEIEGTYSSGILTSEIIGPAKSWTDMDYSVNSEINDVVDIDVLDPQTGQLLTLDPSTGGRTEASIDLSGVDANIYPYLQFRMRVSDEVDFTPAQLQNWAANYVPTPEGVLIIDNQSRDKWAEGEVYSQEVQFINLGADYQDSINLHYVFTFPNIQTVADTLTISAIAESDTGRFLLELPTTGYSGPANLRLSIASSELETYSSNNRLFSPNHFEVFTDNVNPVLDVTVDGQYIMDGDIVSPEPVIRVLLKDDNDYLYKSDTANVFIALKQPGETSVFEPVSFNDARLTWKPASENEDFEVEYVPGRLEDGVYTLRVQAADQSGNRSAEEPYEVSFEVINESTITHFYPYPNPFSTNCRFVFTLTGALVPDNLKIQIMTISGRVVKEIDEFELGPIHIGHNISEYAWDGTDEFGDRLANGVYLYRVISRIQGEIIEHRSTGADGAFTKGYGKLYILR